MDDVAISDWPTDWPGQALDINGSNPWLPAYGFQTPSELLEKDDFIGNPDAEYFLQSGGYNTSYMYLETIQEETSDDLQSDSDLSEARTSPVGWLATDSEAGSVICVVKEQTDYESDRETACPAKRRKQDHNFLSVNNGDEDFQSLSRSSSLLQFETFEKHCQETHISSPSIYSQYSFDSLDVQRKSNVSPDSLDRVQSDGEHESEYYKALKIDVIKKKDKNTLYNGLKTFGGDSDSSDASLGTSEGTLDGRSSRSLDNLRGWRSFDNLPILAASTIPQKTKDEVSAENLSEDSGYSDNILCNSKYITTMTSLNEANVKTHNFDVVFEQSYDHRKPLKFKTSAVDFHAYDGEGFSSFSGNFGTSYQDLSVFDKYEVLENHRSPLIDRFMRRRVGGVQTDVTNNINIDKSQECGLASKYNCTSSSEPNLPGVDVSSVSSSQFDEKLSDSSPKKNRSFLFENSANSVPKDLNLVESAEHSWCHQQSESVAAKNFDLANLVQENPAESLSYCSSNISELLSLDTMSYKREGSYAEAMTNRVDLSDDEGSLLLKPALKHSKHTNTIEAFDKKVLRAISEQSIQSVNSRTDLYEPPMYPPSPLIQNRCFTSTPNVSSSFNQNYDHPEERRRSTQDVRRKSSLRRNVESTSTSGISDLEEKTAASTKSLTESTKGVHFSPLVDEVPVNWHDDSTETERESSYSPRSSSPGSETAPTPVATVADDICEPERISRSQPDLNEVRQEFVQSLKSFQMELTKSQPDMGDKLMKRRGSQVLKKDKDGCLIKAYVDGDGIQYKHTHLDLGHVYSHKPPTTVEITTSTSHVGSGSFNNNNIESTMQQQRQQGSAGSVSIGMAAKPQRDASGARKDKGKLGGFFSRLASFRFSNAKKKNVLSANQLQSSNLSAQPPPQIQQASKNDYIYIPLKGPKDNNNQDNNVDNLKSTNGKISWKPPVPRAPPKIVGASVKRDCSGGGFGNLHHQGGGGAELQERRRRRTTIDSGSRPRPMEPMGLIETDLDTEVTVITDGADVKTRSLLNLGAAQPTRTTAGLHLSTTATSRESQHRPHKSMEFLLDKENIKVVEPPENELQKGERVMSEHQLRVQRSLQKLTIPEWYKQSQIPQEGFLLKKHHNRENRWTGTGSRTTSLSSLGSSPVMLSPTPHNQPFVRWSTSKLNSTASSPCASTRSSFNTRQANGSLSPSSARSSFSYRQPYMGWRSQERLSKPRTPAERLANSLLSTQINQNNQIPNPDIQSSIKEVTSAIVHYVSGLKPDNSINYDSQDTTSQRSSSVSPRGSQKLCWLESSFVGTRPLDSPQTPVALSECSNATTTHSPNLRLELRNHNDISLKPNVGAKPSPSSTTLEDVLDSLLGLPSSARAPSPSLQVTVSANTSPSHKGKVQNAEEQFRRRSEGSEPSSSYTNTRRGSLNNNNSSLQILKCRYPRCGKSASVTTSEGKSYKNCHNCSYAYCSRQCRRAHWEKHRKTCLFSRIGSLCRQVIASVREQKDTLLHLSEMARRGYLSQGTGAVKCFFHNPESAEKFLEKGLHYLGELTYIPWQDLLPNEMGAQMYAELVKMCKNYNPDTKLVLYVSICVISETPMSGAVKWERQLVSRCAKMRLSKEIAIPEKEKQTDNLETLVLTCSPFVGNLLEIKELKEICFNNLLNQLRQRGVSLRRQHPDIFKQLQVYVDNNCAKFLPVTIYPKDINTGRSFMCIIMLEAESASLRQIELAGVKVRTVDVLKD